MEWEKMDIDEVKIVGKPKILFICDVKGWAWWIKSKYVSHYLSNEFDIDIIYLIGSGATKSIDKKKYDLYFTYGYAYVDYLKGLPKNKIITGVTAHRDWKKLAPKMNQAGATHANSLMLFKELQKYHPNAFYVPNGVDENIFKPIVSIPAQRNNIIVGHVGKLSPHKCQKEIIEPAVALAKADYKAHYNTYMDAIPYTKMVSLYQKFDVMVCASKEDATPNPCIIRGSKVITKLGLETAENIREGDSLLTHLGKYRKVTKIYCKKYIGRIVSISSVLNSERLMVTPNHPIFVIRGRYCDRSSHKNTLCKPNCMRKKGGCSHKYYEKYTPTIIKAEEVGKGDFILTPIEQINNAPQVEFRLSDFDPNLLEDEKGRVGYKNSYSTSGVPIKMNNRMVLDMDLMRLIGYYLAEGSTTRGYYIRFALNVKEKKIKEDIINLMFVKFGVTPNKGNNRCGEGISICYGSKILANMFLSFCGPSAKNRTLSSFLYFQPNFLIVPLLKGYFRGDGHIDTTSRSLKLTSASEKLIYQVRNLFFRLGVSSYIAKHFQQLKKYPGKEYLSYDLTIKFPYSKKMLELWESDISFPKKSKTYYKHYMDNNYLYSPVTDISTQFYEGEIYNYEIEEDHTYTVWGQTVHNCLEAASCERPIISVPIGNMPELIKNGYNGFLIPRDIKAMAEKIIFLREHRGQLIEMGKNARKSIEAGWTWKMQSENYRRMFRKILNG